MKLVLRYSVFVGVAFILCACGGESRPIPKISEFTASQEEVEVGGTVEFTLVGSTGSGDEDFDYSGTIRIVGDGLEAVGDEFEVEDERRLTTSFEGPSVSMNFELRFTEPGEIRVAAILITSGQAENWRGVTIMVVDNPVEGVSLNETSVSIEETEQFNLVATVEPSNAFQDVTWSSSDSGVATFTSDGVVTGVGVGEATITATTKQGNKTATCEVTVNPASPGRKMDNAVQLGALEIGNHDPYESVQIPGDTDWYFVFTVADGDYLALAMSATSGLERGKVKGRLYNEEQMSVSQELDIPVLPEFLRVTPPDELGGMYYLRIRIDGERDRLYDLELSAWYDYQ